MTALFRSRIGTDQGYVIDFTGFSVTSGWNTVYDFGKRIAGLAAFIAFSAALFPIWSPSQTAVEQYQLNDLTARVQTLSSLPADVAVIKEHLVEMERRETETQASVEALRTTGTVIILGMLAWMAKELFMFFGTKFGLNGDRKNE